jgi:hypothetical protein
MSSTTSNWRCPHIQALAGLGRRNQSTGSDAITPGKQAGRKTLTAGDPPRTMSGDGWKRAVLERVLRGKNQQLALSTYTTLDRPRTFE